MATLFLLNGGIGKRIGKKEPKQILRINGIPMFIYSLRIADEVEDIEQVILNYPDGWKEPIEDLIKNYAIKTPVKMVGAGESRQESVQLMTELVDDDTIIIHEAARPMITSNLFRELIQNENKNVTTALSIPFTVLQKNTTGDFIGDILERDKLFNVQLPQKFDGNTLKMAHEHAAKNNKHFTEDASLVFDFGVPVALIEGSDRNIKVTTLADLEIAEKLLSVDQGGDLDEVQY